MDRAKLKSAWCLVIFSRNDQKTSIIIFGVNYSICVEKTWIFPFNGGGSVEVRAVHKNQSGLCRVNQIEHDDGYLVNDFQSVIHDAPRCNL